jgi:rubredoxin
MNSFDYFNLAECARKRMCGYVYDPSHRCEREAAASWQLGELAANVRFREILAGFRYG